MNATRLLQFISQRLSGVRLDWTLAIVALVLSVLPARALAPWTSDVARIVAVPIVPLMHLGMLARDAIRPPREAFDPRAPEVVELEMEAERARTMFEQQRLRTEALEHEVLELKGVRTVLGDLQVQLETASVVGVDPTRREGLVRLSVGARHGVHRDSIVVVRGDVFGGLVASEPAEFTSLVRPATRCTLSVRLYPAGSVDPSRDPKAFPGTVLKPLEGGLWQGDLASEAEVRGGEVVRLADDRLGPVSKGLRVGRVRRVIPNESVPGARIVEVEPIGALADESRVIVAIDPPAARGGSEGAPR